MAIEIKITTADTLLKTAKKAIVDDIKITADKYINENTGGDTNENAIRIDTSDATATSDKIKLGKTAYVKGEKVVGTYQDKYQLYIDRNPDTACINMFSWYTTNPNNVTKYLDLSKITNAKRILYRNSGLTTYNNDIYMPSVKNFYEAFRQNTKLTSVEIDVPSGSEFQYMFYEATGLKNIKFTSMKPENIHDSSIGGSDSMAYTFYGCTSLETIDFNIYPFSSSSVYLFTNCTNLKNIYFRDFSGRNFSLPYNIFSPATSLQNIYVPANMVDTLKSTTNWSAYADKIKAI